MINILLAENNRNLRMLMCSYLRQEGYNITEISDIQELKNVLYKNSYHLLILDVDMLDVNTILYVRLKFNKSVILLNEKATSYSKVEICKKYIDARIIKPFSMQVLLYRVDELLKKFENINKNEIEIGKIRVIYKEQSVYVGDNKLKLTLKEYNLICCLIENQGKVLSREQLLKMAWGVDYKCNNRTVDTHIK